MNLSFAIGFCFDQQERAYMSNRRPAVVQRLPGRFLLHLLATLLLGMAPFAQAQTPDRSTPPALGPTPALNLPPVQQFSLPNGLQVLLMEKHGVPLLQVNVALKAGSVYDSPGKYGLAAMTAALLDDGAGPYSALELSDALDYLGARFFISTDEHTAILGLRTPVSRAPEGLNLLSDMLLRPTFPSEEMERLRKERLTALMREHDEPGAIAQVMFREALYGKEHPYGRPSGGNESSLRSISEKDVRTFYESRYEPANAMLVVVGDITWAALKPVVEKAFGDWKGMRAADVPVPDAPQVSGRIIYLVDKPGAAQSVISIGRIGAARSTEDYYALRVLNTVLGGSFTSRLNQNLREDKGYSYGAGSAFVYRPSPGPFVASASVQTAVTGPALSEFMKELRSIMEPIPEEELARAKNYLALSFPANFQSVSETAAEIGEIGRYGLPLDYFDSYTGRILAVTQEEVQKAAARYLDPDNLALIVVGDRAVIEEQVRALDLGQVRLLSVTDVLGQAPVLSEGTN